MSIINNGLLLASEAAGAGGYQVSRSLRFNSSDSGYCSRTFTSAGNRKTWTWAGWVKRSKLGEFVRLFNNTASGANAAIQFMDSDKLRLFDVGIGLDLQTTQVFRDASAWYHFVIVLDTTQATSSNRAKLYVNGSQITTFSTSTYPSQNTDGAINNNVAHQIGSLGGSSEFFNGYLADIHFIDGQALDPTSFTEVSATTGQLIPKAYTGSYGTNGFRLSFSDNSGTTSTTLGKDAAGSNNWTPNNFSVASGSGNDSLVDTPTSYGTDTGVGGEVRGNYATFNPVGTAKISIGNGVASLANGNLDASSGAGWSYAQSTIAVPAASGKYYCEFIINSSGGSDYIAVGANPVNVSYSATFHSGSQAGVFYGNNGNKWVGGSSTSYGASYTTGDIIGVALNCDSGTITFYKNNTLQGSISFNSNLTNANGIIVGVDLDTSSLSANFGARAFSYQAPSGFKALCDTNLPAPVVAKSSDYFQTVLYTGNGSTQTISGLNFSPDFVWVKKRNTAANHYLADTVRGTTKALLSDVTDAEYTSANYITAFNSDGFSVGSDSGYNTSSHTYVAWAWDAGTTTTTNTVGSITSSVRANASAGFSIVSYTSTGGTATVGHGLGIAPSMVITKGRNVISAFITQHVSLAANNVLYLNGTDASQDVSGNGSLPKPTSTVFSVNNQTGSNGGTYNMIAYCFAPVAGYSAIGSYIGNSSADGPFVYTGFRPRFIMVKNAEATTDWVIIDTARETFNVVDDFLRPNLSAAEGTRANLAIDILSNGFKHRGLDNYLNGSNTHVYIAFAESPFQYARAR